MSVSQRDLDLIADFLRPKAPAPETPKVKCSEWIEKNFYLSDSRQLIQLQPHQRTIIDYGMDPNRGFSTFVYSAPKKSGKTAIGGAIGRYLAENSGHRAEIYAVANDLEQARSRSYQAIVSSIELTPGFDRSKNILPGKWKIIEKHAIHLPTNSIVRAISNDHAGEAGSNPVATLWTELWGLKTESSKRLWAELTPVLTRERSMRIVETYAGYEDESKVLLNLYKTGMKGERLTHNDIDWPFPDQPPIWVNKQAGIFMYWDSGEIGRRMPWQQGERARQYYIEQRIDLLETEFERLHNNNWQSTLTAFIKEPQWNACIEQLPKPSKHEPGVLGVDASVSNDCTAIAYLTRHPDPARFETDVAVRDFKIWYPPRGGTIDLQEVEDEIRHWCANKYNIVQLTYDEFQLHQMVGRLNKDAVVWCRKFSQMNPRAVADKQLYDMILRRHLAHNGHPLLLEHVNNASAKSGALEQGKLRIVKKNDDSPVDVLVAISMAAFECLRLQL